MKKIFVLLKDDELKNAPDWSLRDEVRRVTSEVLRLRKQAATITALRAMLKRLEWDGYDNDFGYSFCLICDGKEPTHAPGCELDAILKGSEE